MAAAAYWAAFQNRPKDKITLRQGLGRAGAASRENVSPLPNVSNVYLTYLTYLMASRGSAQIREERSMPAFGLGRCDRCHRLLFE